MDLLIPHIAEHNAKIVIEWARNSTEKNQKLFCALSMSEDRKIHISALKTIKREDLIKQFRILADAMEKQKGTLILPIDGSNG